MNSFLSNALSTLRSLWNPVGRLVSDWNWKSPLKGFRLARTGKHKDTRLTRHEQTRNPPGTKLWRRHCKWEGA